MWKNVEYIASARCLSEDKRIMYAVAMNFNQLISYDLEEKKILDKIRIEDEEENYYLFIQIVCCCNKLFLFPRNAKFFHVIDLKSKKQYSFEAGWFAANYIINYAGTYSVKHEDKIYVVGREPERIFVIDAENLKVSEIKKSIECKLQMVNALTFHWPIVYLYDYDNNIVDVVNLETGYRRELFINIDKLKCDKTCYFREKYYIIDNNNSKLFCLDSDMQLVYEKELLDSFFLLYDKNDIYLIPEVGEKGFCVTKDFKQIQIVKPECKKIIGPSFYLEDDSMLCCAMLSKASNDGYRRFMRFNTDTNTIEYHGIILSPEDARELYDNSKKPVYETSFFGIEEFINTIIF